MPKSHGAPGPVGHVAEAPHRRQACANVSAVRSSAAASDPVSRWNHARIQTA